MTTLALVAGMLPMALGTGPGADERRAIAVVVIGGQSLCLLLTLLVTPVAYSLFEDAKDSHAWKRFANLARRDKWTHFGDLPSDPSRSYAEKKPPTRRRSKNFGF